MVVGVDRIEDVAGLFEEGFSGRKALEDHLVCKPKDLSSQ